MMSTTSASAEQLGMRATACVCTEWRPGSILAARAQALDEVQDIIEAIGVGPPSPRNWERLQTAAFPPPPMA